MNDGMHVFRIKVDPVMFCSHDSLLEGPKMI